MKSKTPKLKVALTLAILAGVTVSSQAAVSVSFGETVPTSNIITSYQPASLDALTWLYTPDTHRLVAQSFVTPADSSYLVSAITMQLNGALGQSFSAPSGFSIGFYRLAGPGENPAAGTVLATQTGSMQPTTAEAQALSYLSFNLDTPLVLEAGASYGYVLSFDSQASYNSLLLAVSSSAPDPNGSRAWTQTDGGGWANVGETYVYYIEGTAVPEPGAIALLGLAGVLVLAARRKVAASNKS